MLIENSGRGNQLGCQPINAYLDSVLKDLTSPPSEDGAHDVKRLSTGYSRLDEITSGLRLGSLTVIAGRPSIGKTSLALNIAQRVALEQEKGVLIFSIDFDGKRTVDRILSSISRVDLHRIQSRRLDDTQRARIDLADQQLRNADIFIDDSATGLEEICARTQSLINIDESIKLVVIDDLQYLAPDTSGGDKTEAVMLGLKRLAQKLGIAVILTTILSRRLEMRRDRHPMLKDLPQGIITGGADLVLTIYRDEYYGLNIKKAVAEISVMRNRHGHVGLLELFFYANCCHFESLGNAEQAVT